jgi:hypothetical protein
MIQQPYFWVYIQWIEVSMSRVICTPMFTVAFSIIDNIWVIE